MSRIAKKLGLEVLDTPMGLFEFSVRCVMGNYENSIKYAAHIFEEDEQYFMDMANDGFAPRGRTFYKTQYVPIIWVEEYPKTPRGYATLAHECIHAINNMFDWVSMPLCRETEEVFAHSVAHVMNNVLEKMKPKEENI